MSLGWMTADQDEADWPGAFFLLDMITIQETIITVITPIRSSALLSLSFDMITQLFHPFPQIPATTPFGYKPVVRA